MLNAILECHVAGPHALSHEVSAFLCVCVYIYIYIEVIIGLEFFIRFGLLLKGNPFCSE